MVKVVTNSPLFDGKLAQLDKSQRIKLKKLMLKIEENPKIGKPMRYERKSTREVYMKPFRLSYEYDQHEDHLTFLDLYHKKHQ